MNYDCRDDNTKFFNIGWSIDVILSLSFAYFITFFITRVISDNTPIINAIAYWPFWTFGFESFGIKKKM